MSVLPVTLSSFFPEEICELAGTLERFRGKQIFKWIASGVTTFDEMQNVPRKIKDFFLQSGISVCSVRLLQKLKDPDGTIKLQLAVDDSAAIETVLLTDKEGRHTACISTQIGCAMKCAFCKTGQLGFSRNLSAGEIAEQFYTLEREADVVLDNVVFMGMGEPLMNLAQVRKAVALLSHPDGRNFSKRRFTVSTSGIINGILDLADNGPDIRLAVSLTVANQELRASLMPVAVANPLDALKKALLHFTEKTGNRITLEAALMGDVNTDSVAADELISFAQDLHPHINLIPWNPVDGLPFSQPSAHEVANLCHRLEEAGLQVTVRMHRGRKIGGACGQLGKVTKSDCLAEPVQDQ